MPTERASEGKTHESIREGSSNPHSRSNSPVDIRSMMAKVENLKNQYSVNSALFVHSEESFNRDKNYVSEAFTEKIRQVLVAKKDHLLNKTEIVGDDDARALVEWVEM